SLFVTPYSLLATRYSLLATRYSLNPDEPSPHPLPHRPLAAEAALDGLYVIRTSVASTDMTPAQAVLSYKQLAEVERAFRTLKGVDLQVRRIRHRLEARVRAHILLSILAYYVQWHMIVSGSPAPRFGLARAVA
ncbi:MAG: transposase, partial [Hyphomicrobiaceae bacterium]